MRGRAPGAVSSYKVRILAQKMELVYTLRNPRNWSKNMEKPKLRKASGPVGNHTADDLLRAGKELHRYRDMTPEAAARVRAAQAGTIEHLLPDPKVATDIDGFTRGAHSTHKTVQ